MKLGLIPGRPDRFNCRVAQLIGGLREFTDLTEVEGRRFKGILCVLSSLLPADETNNLMGWYDVPTLTSSVVHDKWKVLDRANLVERRRTYFLDFNEVGVKLRIATRITTPRPAGPGVQTIEFFRSLASTADARHDFVMRGYSEKSPRTQGVH